MSKDTRPAPQPRPAPSSDKPAASQPAPAPIKRPPPNDSYFIKMEHKWQRDPAKPRDEG